jgi:TonB family protein
MNLRFWRNVALIGSAHVAAIVGLIRWSAASKTPVSQNVTWLSGGAEPSLVAPKSKSLATPATREPDDTEDASQPALTSAKSEIQLPTATPTPSPKSTSTPRPTPEVKVTPPKRPHPKPKPTPKPSPKKLVVAKASPKAKPTPEKEDVDLAKKEEKAATPQPNESPNVASNGKGSSAGGSGHGGGATIQAQFGWYGSMLHDRFYSEWAQPTNVDAANSVLAKVRIERDGHISSFEIVRPSGNDAIDESVRAAAKRVTHVDPLPAGLGGDHYDVKIKFELSSD